MDYINKLNAINSKIDSINVNDNLDGGSGMSSKTTSDVYKFIRETGMYIIKDVRYAGGISSPLLVIFIILLFTDLSKTVKKEEDEDGEEVVSRRFNFGKTLGFTILFFIPVFVVSFIILGFVLRNK